MDAPSPTLSCWRDETLEDSANLPDPDVLAQEIVEELEAALEQFRGIAESLEDAS